MVEFTTMRICAGISLAWPLFWILVFDRWFLLSPLGLLVAFGMPIAAWVSWWKLFRGEEQKFLSEAGKIVAKNVAIWLKLKNRLGGQR